ncbi:MAG: FAD-dependent oxidoreductase [Pseudomonadota bacterium]
MNTTHFTVEIDADGIALVTWDMADKSMNVIDQAVLEDLEKLVPALEADDAVKGVVITSAKATFCAGADLTMLEGLLGRYHAEKEKDAEGAMQAMWQEAARLSKVTRAIETGTKPYVAALPGLALGGGFEVALACHARVAAENKSGKVGLPEVKVGLLPGSGGTQRVPRMIDPQAAMEMLLQGKEQKFDRAVKLGLIDEIVPPKKLIDAAKAKLAGLSPKKAWDQPKFRPPVRVYSAAGMQLFPAANAIMRRETYNNYPAAKAILSCVYEGNLVDMDTALRIESRYFAHVLQTPEAKHMIRSLFVSMQDLNKGARRPADVPDQKIKKVGVIGAGFMGAGIAYVTAKAGIKVALIDRDQESADKGLKHSQDLVTKQVSRGRMDKADGEKLVSLIEPSADYASLSDCDLVIEAVFENRELKEQIFAQCADVMKRGAILASNTSTLPITGLAKATKKPRDFIGIHFFSPVDRMMLVEIIMGKRTGDKALARALDYVKAIKKTPIVVNDTRGFYANRCVTAYMLEAHKMLSEGVPPAMVENAAKMAGMPVGPLTLNDEVAVDLAWKILQATKADLGEKAVDPAQEHLLDQMVNKHGRVGKKAGKGFFDYNGRDKSLWPGLADIFEPKPASEFSIDELKERFLVIQALEAARCMAEGVVVDPREADVGSILGFGFAPWSGGTLSYIDGMGTTAFVDLAKRLQKKHGVRFKPNRLLTDMAKTGEAFYERFGEATAKAA